MPHTDADYHLRNAAAVRPSDESSLPRHRQFCFYDELSLLLVLNGTKGQDRSGTFSFYITFNVQSSSLSGK